MKEKRNKDLYKEYYELDRSELEKTKRMKYDPMIHEFWIPLTIAALWATLIIMIIIAELNGWFR